MDKYARFRFQPCLPLGKDGRRVTASPEHISLSRNAASQGMVLLKNNDNALPLAKGEKIALFGKATIEYIKGGGGSGDVHCPYIRNIYEGFEEKEKEGKVKIYMPLVDFYKEYVKRESVNVLTEEQINVEELESVLKELFEEDVNVLQNESRAGTNIRRLIRIYDYLKWGK